MFNQSATHTPPDRGRQRFLLVLVAITRITGGALFGTAVTVYLGREASPLVVTASFSLFSLGLLLFAPVWGAIADVTGRRKLVLVVTALGSTLATAPLAFSVSVPLQIGCRVLFAAFTAGFQSAILTVVSESGGDTNRGRSIGFFSSAQSVGDIVGRLFVGYLLGLLAPTGLYAVIAGLLLVATLLVALIADPTEARARSDSVVAEFRRRLVPGRAHADLFAERGLGWLYVGLFFRNVSQKGLSAVFPLFLVSNVGLSNVTMGVVLAVSPAVRVVSMYLTGQLADYTGRKRLIVVGLVGSGLQCVLVVVALFPSSVLGRIGVSAAVQIVHALTFSALVVGSVAFIGDVAPVNRESELMGLRSTARGAGGVVGPLLVGVIASAANYSAAFLTISSLSFVAAFLVARKLSESHTVSETSESVSPSP